ncbi:L,D-transpeptidase family protein [Verrucomicrobiota bacterium sgz303538]
MLGVLLSFCTAGAVNQARAQGSRIKIDLSEQRAYLYSGGRVVDSAPVSTGREGHRTPSGTFRVHSKERFHRSTLYGDYVGPGGGVVKRNVDIKRSSRPAGARFRGASMPYYLKITRNAGLHAGYLPGYPASHGCIRLPAGKAQEFYNAVSVGTPVTITH